MDDAIKQSRRLFAARRLDEAAALLRAVVVTNPNHLDALSLLGVIALQTGEYQQAVRLIQQAIMLQPTTAELHVNLASAFEAQGLHDDAIGSCETAIRLKPNLMGAYQNLAQVLHIARRFEETEACCRKAISIDPNHAMIHNCLAIALQGLGRLTEAESASRTAMSLAPNSSQVFNTLGTLLTDLGRLDESIAAFERSIALKPNSPTAHFNYAMALLLSGDLRKGFVEYEWRWQGPGMESTGIRTYEFPRWDGSDLAGKSLLLTAEQGFGDAIQFIRFAPQIASRCRRLVIACQPELAPLISGVPGIAQIIGPNEEIEGIDAQLPLMSVPRVLGTDIQNIPRTVPYLRSDAQKRERWRARIDHASSAAGHRKIGLAWAGNAAHANDRRRSIPAAQLSSLSRIDGITWYNLQKPAGAESTRAIPQLPLVDFTADFADFSETAAFLDNLELVITADTAIAHLAGALGKLVWILLPFAPDWRWMRDRVDSPWYPTATLFRQPTPGDWTSVIRQVRDALIGFTQTEFTQTDSVSG